MFINRTKQFNFWAKRLVFAENAEQAIAQATEDKKDVSDITPQQLADTAKEKIQVPDEAGKARDKALSAKSRIDQLTQQLQEAVNNIKARTTLQARLSAVNPAHTDFLHQVNEMKDIRAKNSKLPSNLQLPADNLSAADSSIEKAAADYYESREKVDWMSKEKGIDAPQSPDACRKIMADISEMQQALAGGFPGLAEGQKEAMMTAYRDLIQKGLDTLKTNEAKNLMPADEKLALNEFDRARTNLEAAEKGKEAGHKAGAEQYMGMVLAEQEARRIWQQLPVSEDADNNWRPKNSITDSLDANQPGWGENLPLYNEAVGLFNKAKQTSLISEENKEQAGKKYEEAAKLYKDAANKFRELLAKAVPQTSEEKEKNMTPRAKAEKAKTDFLAFDGELTGRPYYADISKSKAADLQLAGQKFLNEKKYAQAQERFAEALKVEQDLVREYLGINKLVQDRLRAAINHFVGFKKNSLNLLKKSITDFLSPTSGTFTDFQKKYLQRFIAQETVNYPFGSGQVIKVSFDGEGKPAVEVRRARSDEIFVTVTTVEKEPRMLGDAIANAVQSNAPDRTKMNSALAELMSTLTPTEKEMLSATPSYEVAKDNQKYQVTYMGTNFKITKLS